MSTVDCLICGRIFKNLKDLSLHYFDQHKAKFTCSWCPGQFLGQADLADHISKIHVGKSNFTCRVCPHYCTQKKALNDHYLQFHKRQEDKLCCAFCKIWFTEEDILILHIKRVHGEKKLPKKLTPNKGSVSASDPVAFRCQFCPMHFGSRNEHCSHSILAHRAFLLCSFCEKQFEFDEELRVHVHRAHEMMKSWTCVCCWLSFKDEQLLQAHQNSVNHKPIQCPECKIMAPNVECLSMHSGKHESAPASIEIGPTSCSLPRNLNMLLCLTCFQRVPAAAFDLHAVNHLSERKPLSCNECFQLLTDIDSVKHHLDCFRREASCGLGNSGAALICTECGFRTSTKTQLSRHKGWCHTLKPCQYCSIQCTGRVGLKIHGIEHGFPVWPDDQDIKPIVTNVRNSESSSNSSFTESESKVEEMPGCSKKFRTGSDLQPLQHQTKKRKHDEDHVVNGFATYGSPSTRKPENRFHESERNLNGWGCNSTTPKPPKVDPEKASFLNAVAKLRDEIVSDDSPSEDETDGSEAVTIAGTVHRQPSPPRPLLDFSSGTAERNKRKYMVNEKVVTFSSSSTAAFSSFPAENITDSSDSDDQDEPTHTISFSSKIIPVGSMLGSNQANKQFSAATPATLNSPPVEQSSAANSRQMSPAQQQQTVLEYKCLLCNKTSVYKQSANRHVMIVHRVPFDKVFDHISISKREKQPSPPPAKLPQKPTNQKPPAEQPTNQKPPGEQQQQSKKKNVCCRCSLTCRGCTRKAEKIKELKNLLRTFKTVAVDLEKVLAK